MEISSELKKVLAYEETFSCVQCGYCLPSCPTYIAFGKESHSPRGRIHLVKMTAEGKITLNELKNSIEICLACRACETVCPLHVKYGKIYESAHTAISQYSKQTIKEKAIRKVVLEKGLSSKKMLRIVGKTIDWYQRAKLDKFVRSTHLNRVLPKPIREIEMVLPKVEKSNEMSRKYMILKPKGKPVMRVGFFVGCVMDAVFGRINDLSMRLLCESGCEVVLIEEQTCCGALQQHTGETEKAKELAKENIAAFEKYHFDYIVNSIGGCGAMLVEYPLLFEGDENWFHRAVLFSNKVKDISWILNQLPLPFINPIEKSAVYQPSCHLRNVQKVKNEPVSLIKKIPGLTYISMPTEHLCCGSAGVYNIIHYDEASKILDLKMKDIKDTIPDYVITSNPGCHLQLLHGVKREGLESRTKVVHIVEILAEACGLT